jgi:hypothetical protein
MEHASLWMTAILTVAAHAQAPSVKRPPTASTMKHCLTNLVHSKHVRASVELDSGERRIEVEWRYSPSATFLFEDSVRQSQTRSTTYWPTAVEVIGSDRILVAGKDPETGATLIETWTLRAPKFEVPPPTPELWPQPDLAAEVALVHRSATADRDIVRAMLAVRGKPSSVFVHFYDSRDLYEFDWSAPQKPMSLVLSAKSQPLLSTDGWNSCWGGDHKTHGFVYVFAELDCVPTVPSLVLVDSNRDGVVDSHGMDLAKFHELGLAKGEEYTEYCGLCRD